MEGTVAFNETLFVVMGLGGLAFARIVAIMIQAPILGSKHFNTQVRIGTALALTMLAFPNLPVPDDFPEEMRGFLLAILTQIVVGLCIGMVSFMTMAAAQFGGEMLDIQMGLSVAASMDPSSGGASKLLNRLMFYIAMLLFLVVDGHHQFMIAIYRSFELIPLTYFRVSGALIEQLIRLTGEIFLIGIQIAAPALAALFITQVALGLLARVAPQMNVFMLSFPLNIAIGLMLVSVGLPVITRLLKYRFEVTLDEMFRAMGHMVPPAGGP